VQAVLDTFYAQSRVQTGAVAWLRDDEDSPPESLLQSIWQHQRLRRMELFTTDGRPVNVLHPGFRNWEGGPDFRGAIIQIGGETITGDIEVDLRRGGWHTHGHDRNPNFGNVVLHVIWEGDRPASGGPVALSLKSRLDAPLGELSLWLGAQPAQLIPESWRGRCCRAFRGVALPKLGDFLHQAARVRLQGKAARFEARAKEAGWDQALWEGLLRALGYKNNVWPMQRLGELRHLCVSVPGLPGIQARLFGLSGLLPAELPRGSASSRAQLRQLWDEWWRERDALAEHVLPRAAWRLSGLRPANHPHRRLALGSHWLVNPQLPARLLQWSAREIAPKQCAASVLEILCPPPDGFWDWHYTLTSARSRQRLPLLGQTRVTDLVVNVILPWAWAQTKGTKQKEIERRYFAWPAAQDNSVLKLARQRLLGGALARNVPGAAAQQGLMQIVKDFCETSNSLCEDCKLPGMVEEWLRRAAENQVIRSPKDQNTP
jgi:hypothetical protein